MQFEFNYEVLKKYIKDSIFTTKDVCELIGVPETTFYWKIKNNKLTIAEFFAIVEILCLDETEVLEILRKREDD